MKRMMTLLFAATCLGGCEIRHDPPDMERGAAAGSADAGSDTAAGPDGAAPADVASNAGLAAADSLPGYVARWSATPRGVGPVRVGMTATQANASLDGALDAPAEPEASCDYAGLRGAPAGRIGVMLVDGVIARIDVRSRAVPTDLGARVGDAETRVRSLYGDRLEVQPHKYTDGHYLVVTPESAADSAYRLIFETSRDSVTTYRVGRRPEVEWVEGCS